MDQIGRHTLAKDLVGRGILVLAFLEEDELTCKQIPWIPAPNFEQNAIVKAVKG
jgi:hypothetical protein